MQDDQTWCGSTSLHGTVPRTIIRSLWSTLLPYRTSK